MLTTQAVGIDLGTTYSCIAHLNAQGEPVSLPNAEGELTTPSVVLFDDDAVVVGTEALRHSIIRPDRVVQNAKRYMGDLTKTWTVAGKTYTPTDIAGLVVRKLLQDAEAKIGKIERAVITVPAQFSDAQRRATIEVGIKAGLSQVDIINEPVAGALCYVLGEAGLWFTELADEQRILVYDLGGGTFDLSVVKYHKNEVTVVASTGDLHLGGLDWNQALINKVADQFQREFGDDPRRDLESLQFLSWEAEQCKRSLTIRPKAALVCQHRGKRKTYQIEQEQFNRLTQPLVQRTEEITKQMLKDHKLGWARIDVVLTTGGSSRMPMIRDMLKRLSGRTLNTTLSPDQSIAHGAAYYAGMLLSNSEFAKSILTSEAAQRLAKVKQRSVTARGLGILVRDDDTHERVPVYLVAPNTPLPASSTEVFGTVRDGQSKVVLRVIESGERADMPHVELGTCRVDGLPPNLPANSEIAVTISYDTSARVHVSAVVQATGQKATAEIIRPENLRGEALTDESDEATVGPRKPASSLVSSEIPVLVPGNNTPSSPRPAGRPSGAPAVPVAKPATSSTRPAPVAPSAPVAASGGVKGVPVAKPVVKASEPSKAPTARPPAPPKPALVGPDDDDEIIELPVAHPAKPAATPPVAKPAVKPAVKPVAAPVAKPAVRAVPPSKPPVPPSANTPTNAKTKGKKTGDAAADEFWNLPAE